MAIGNTLEAPKANSLEITYKAGNADVKLSPQTVKKYLVSGNSDNITNQEIVMFINLCKYQGLNPFLREAYLIKYGTSPATIVVGKSAFEKRAARCEHYKGFDAGIVVYRDGIGFEERTGTVMMSDETLVGGWAEIYVEGYKKPVKVTVSFDEYAGRKSDGSLNAQWTSKPATMIRKVAKVQALREAFPENFEGMYAAEEMGEAEPLMAEPVELPPEQPAETNVETDFESILEGEN